eukprot:754045-Hanusia_phi.AAC.2
MAFSGLFTIVRLEAISPAGLHPVKTELEVIFRLGRREPAAGGKESRTEGPLVVSGLWRDKTALARDPCQHIEPSKGRGQGPRVLPAALRSAVASSHADPSFGSA